MISGGAVIVSLDGSLQAIALLAYLNLSMNLDLSKLDVLVKYGLPTIGGLLFLFIIAISFTGKWIIEFLVRFEKKEILSDEELVDIQKKLVNFPYRIAVLGCMFWVVTLPIAVSVLAPAFGWGAMEIFFASVGGLIGGLFSMPFSVYSACIITYPLMDMTFEMSPTVPRGGKVGFSMPLSWKISLSFIIMLFGFIIYVGMAGYARIILYQMEDVMGGLLLNFSLLSLSILALTALLAMLAAHDITSMLKRLGETTERIAQGDLGERAHVITNDEVGELAGVVNSMGEKLENNRNLMDNLQKGLDTAAGELLEATRKILAVGKEHFSGATQQSVAISQVSSTHDMILDTARQVAESAEDSENMAVQVLNATDDGIERSAQTLEGVEELDKNVSDIAVAMTDVKDCVGRVGEALRVIDDIAERTNLLSLNAALEAAGAGSAGQRFAVLADQIRRLAEKSRSSSKNIEILMEEIDIATTHATEITQTGKGSVSTGLERVRGIRYALDSINVTAKSSTELAQKIDLVSRQQRTSLEQTSTTLKDLVHSADLILEGTRTTEAELSGLEKLAERIRSMIFQYDNGVAATSEVG